eukprot:m51a1_g7249 putative beta- -mannosyl-glycoprotein 4-beta-n-acetylglucosaminyltransferase-like (395) ;mRNA; f:135625-136882
MEADERGTRRRGARRGGPGRRLVAYAALLTAATMAFAVLSSLSERPLLETLTYLTRPAWDSPSPVPRRSIVGVYAEGVADATLCALHGWSPRGPGGRPPRVVDAVIFSTELDLLEIRIRELWDVRVWACRFVVIEAPLTFMGVPKPLVLRDNIERFRWALDAGKLVHGVAASLLGPAELRGRPFENEKRTRQAMARLLLRAANLSDGDLLVAADVDEVPAARALRLFRACVGYPDRVALAMPTFLYSFEFPRRAEPSVYRASVRVYRRAERAEVYCRSCLADVVLEDAGWHCSWCFRTLAEIRFKMRSFSHADRLASPALLDEERLQRVVCSGSDVFGMLPEAFTWRALVANSGPTPPARSAVHVPRPVVENASRFAFLLPGHCRRPVGDAYDA